MVLFALFCLLPQNASAQFEGEIEFRSYEPEKLENPQSMFRFVATPQRIMISSENRYRAFGVVEADRFLVRNDVSDFVFLSGDSDAFKITTDDIDSLTQLLQRMQGAADSGAPSFDWDKSLEETGETKTIHGYNVQKINVYEQGSPNNYVAVWLTEEIKVRWGILENIWHRSLSGMFEVNLPVEVLMNRNSFPLKIEYYEDGRLSTMVEAVGVRQGPVDGERVGIPAGIKMTGFADIMMRLMRNRR